MIAMTTDDFRAMRHAMVTSQLRTNAVSDPRVIAAMDEVPRETFVPTGARDLAYRDTAVPIGDGRALNLPVATGRLLSEAALRPTDHVLLIGAGTGYTAAVLALLAGRVTAVESDAALAEAARTNGAVPSTVTFVSGPLADGHAGDAPYDVIVVDGAVARVPDALWRQLDDGGRIVTGIVERGVTRLAAGRRSRGGAGLTEFVDMDCIILPGFDRPPGFAF